MLSDYFISLQKSDAIDKNNMPVCNGHINHTYVTRVLLLVDCNTDKDDTDVFRVASANTGLHSAPSLHAYWSNCVRSAFHFRRITSPRPPSAWCSFVMQNPRQAGLLPAGQLCFGFRLMTRFFFLSSDFSFLACGFRLLSVLFPSSRFWCISHEKWLK